MIRMPQKWRQPEGESQTYIYPLTDLSCVCGRAQRKKVLKHGFLHLWDSHYSGGMRLLGGPSLSRALEIVQMFRIIAWMSMFCALLISPRLVEPAESPSCAFGSRCLLFGPIWGDRPSSWKTVAVRGLPAMFWSWVLGGCPLMAFLAVSASVCLPLFPSALMPIEVVF